MARRTDIDILIDVLRGLPRHQASRGRVGLESGWSADKVERVVRRAVAVTSGAVFIGRGGIVKYRGSERGADVGLYADVERIISAYWGHRSAGLRNVSVLRTARSGRRSAGVWTHPDLVIAADPRRRDSLREPRRLHAVEVETASGFDLRSIYQAHAQGRGADYSWVFGSLDPGVPDDHWDRMLWTAQELGVGLVLFEKPGAFTTWDTILTAERKAVTAKERESFIEVAIGESLRLEHDL